MACNIYHSSADERMTYHKKQVMEQLWVTEVISGTGFYALSKLSKDKAMAQSAILADQMRDSYTSAERVIPRMVSGEAHGRMGGRHTRPPRPTPTHCGNQ